VDPFEVIALAAWSFAVALAGGLVGLVLGNIRLPVVLLAASTPAAGAGANIGISGIAAAAASITHIREGRVHWRLFAVMAPPSVIGALAGGYVSGLLPKNVLLVVIGATLLYFGVDLLRPERNERPGRRREDGLNYTAAVVSGAIVGFMGGVVGLILGSLRVPALLRFVGEGPALAAGTNLAVGVCVGVAGVFGHVPGGVDWDVLAVGGIASIPAAVIGASLTGRLSEADLLRAIGAILVVAGLATAAQAVT
jgi:uncharacterized membrane protein YfcA